MDFIVTDSLRIVPSIRPQPSIEIASDALNQAVEFVSPIAFQRVSNRQKRRSPSKVTTALSLWNQKWDCRGMQSYISHSGNPRKSNPINSYTVPSDQLVIGSVGRSQRFFDLYKIATAQDVFITSSPRRRFRRSWYRLKALAETNSTAQVSSHDAQPTPSYDPFFV